MILFGVCTLAGVIALALWTPLPDKDKPRRDQYAYRHPEAAARHTAPRSTVRFK